MSKLFACRVIFHGFVDQVQRNVGPDRSGSKMFDILMVFLKEFFKKWTLKKISIRQKISQNVKHKVRIYTERVYLWCAIGHGN